MSRPAWWQRLACRVFGHGPPMGWWAGTWSGQGDGFDRFGHCPRCRLLLTADYGSGGDGVWRRAQP